MDSSIPSMSAVGEEHQSSATEKEETLNDSNFHWGVSQDGTEQLLLKLINVVVMI